MFAMLVGGAYSIVDTIFIGRGIGEVGLAAVALTWPLVLMLVAFGDLAGSGAAVIMAQSRGKEDIQTANSALANMFYLMFAAYILFCLPSLYFLEDILRLMGANAEMMPDSFAYAKALIIGALAWMMMTGFVSTIRNDGSPLISMWIMIIGLCSNIFLDWLFIFEFHWGASGAAWASVLSQSLACVLGFAYFFTPLANSRFKLISFKLNLPLLKNVCVTGIPVFGGILTIIAMLYMHNAQSLKYGGTAGLAAYTTVACLESLGSMLMTGLAGGIQPLTAYMYGAGERVRQNRIGNYGYVAALILGIVLMLFSFAMRDAMPEWVGLSGEVSALASRGILISAAAFLLLGVIRVAAYYYQATGKIFDSSTLIYGDAFVALPLCLYTLPIWFEMDGVWLAMPLSRLILFVLLFRLWFFKPRYSAQK